MYSDESIRVFGRQAQQVEARSFKANPFSASHHHYASAIDDQKNIRGDSTTQT